jgi:hypothetical protein
MPAAYLQPIPKRSGFTFIYTHTQLNITVSAFADRSESSDNSLPAPPPLVPTAYNSYSREIPCPNSRVTTRKERKPPNVRKNMLV